MNLIVDFENTPLWISEKKGDETNSLFSNNLIGAKINFSGHGGGIGIELTSHSMKVHEDGKTYEHSEVSVYFRLSEKGVMMLNSFLNGYVKLVDK